MEQVEDKFVQYYDQASVEDKTLFRSQALMDLMLGVRQQLGLSTTNLSVVDLGCAAGAQSMMWARQNHRVYGLDISEGLIRIAKKRASENGYDIDFRVGSATQLPWDSQIADVCILPELLEHVEDWQSCVDEAMRMVKPNGTLYLSTSNVLCPKQYEFALPLYSWYPKFIKNQLVKLSVTSKPHWVNHAEYPAVHWFSFFQLQKYFAKHGFVCKDKFDILLDTTNGGVKYWLAKLITSNPLFRRVGHMFVPYTTFVAIRNNTEC